MKDNHELVSTMTDLVYLRPEDVYLDLDVQEARPLYDQAAEAKEIQELAESIVRDGQLEPIVVRPAPIAEGEDRYYLIAGRRRIEAIFYLNSLRSKEEGQLTVSAVVNRSGIEPFKAALAENLKRKGLSPIQLAMVCQTIREKENWKGGKSTKKVAEYLQVSPATVTTHEKLLTLPEDVKSMVHRGEVSAKAAFDLLDVTVEKREEVLGLAREKQTDEARIEATAEPELAPEQVYLHETPVANTPKALKKAPVKSKRVRSASREIEGALEKPKARSRRDIMDFFEMADSPAYGYPDGQVRMFIVYFLKWCGGEGSDRTLRQKFDVMTDKADTGTPASLEPKESGAPAKKPTKKQTVKPKPKPSPKKKTTKKK